MKIYKLLLHLYPSSFRAEYGDELCRIFLQERNHISGFFSVLFFWITEILDVFVNAILVHWEIFIYDLRFSIRTLSRTPGFAVTAILVTALGIGANTAVFSVINHVLIRPLPYTDPERIVRVWEIDSEYSRFEASPPNYQDWKNRSKSFESLAAFTPISMNLVGNGPPEKVDGAWVTSSLFPLLGVKPVIGRFFTPKEDRLGAPRNVLISYGLWQSRFGGDPRTVGKQIQLNDRSYTIIGVMPAKVFFPTSKVRFWIPFQFDPDQGDADRNNNYLLVVGKLKQNVSLDQARSEMMAVTERLEREYPVENAKVRARIEQFRDGVSEKSRLLLTILLGASTCVLLIACTNLANLFLVRAVGRKKELTVRAALGAGRDRLVRQLLTESILFALFGGLLGILVAHAALPSLAKLIPPTLPIGEASIMDVRVLGFAILLLGVTTIVSGIIPSLRVFSGMDASGLREGSRSGIGGKKDRIRSVLVVVAVTASVILLIGSGLLIRALWSVQSVDPGFNAENVLTLNTPLLGIPKYDSTGLRNNFYSHVVSQIRALPQVSNAAYISFLPMVMGGGIWPIDSVNGVKANPGEALSASLRYVTPGFFDTLRIPVIRGRDVSDSDTLDSQMVAVVSNSFAKRYWPNENPIGRQFRVAFSDRTIVGIAADIRVRGLERNSEPQVYLPSRQVPDGNVIFYVPKYLVIRNTSNTATLLAAVRKIIQHEDPEMPVTEVQTLQEIVDSDTVARRTQIRVIVTFTVLSILLAGIGIHGLLSFAVSERTAEFGLRMALGAQTKDILRMVLRKGFQVAIIGGCFGLILAYVSARVMQAVLAGIRPADATTFLVACAIAILTTISGCLVPALKAVKIDPAKVMHVD
jgi:predicted permease